jgi:hypothetical protein
MYKVLWFDDEHNTLESVKEEALLAKIKLVGYTNAEEGVKELKSSYNEYHAIILDGLFFKNAVQAGTALNQDAFGEVAKALTELKAQNKIIPWFIYSGQTSFVKSKNTLVELFKESEFANGKVFDKNKDEDLEELLNEIKKAADKQPVFQLKASNPEIFELFERGCLSDEVEKQLIELLLKKQTKGNYETKEVLTNIRSIQESCFLKLESVGVLPKLDKFSIKLKHLSGNINPNNKFKPTTQVYQTPDIENLQKWIYFTCGNYIHYLENEHNDGYMISNYAVESLKYGLLELLLWYKKVYKENS